MLPPTSVAAEYEDWPGALGYGVSERGKHHDAL
jgi:hypothetical protein